MALSLQEKLNQIKLNIGEEEPSLEDKLKQIKMNLQKTTKETTPIETPKLSLEEKLGKIKANIGTEAVQTPITTPIVSAGLGLPLGPQSTPEMKPIPESKAKDILDAIVLSTSDFVYNTKQYVDTLKNSLFAPVTTEELKKTVGKWGIPGEVVTPEVVDYVNKNNKKITDDSEVVRKRTEDNYMKWLQDHPDLMPRPEWEGGVREVYKKNPKIIQDPAFWLYSAANSFTFSTVAKVSALGVGWLTGSPLLGMVASTTANYPAQAQALNDALIANGATKDQAAKLSVLIGLLIASVESVGDLPFLASISPAFGKIFKKNITDTVAKGLLGYLTKGATTFAKIELSETLEEVVQGAIQDATLQTVNENINLLKNIPDTILNSLVAVAPTALLGVGGDINNTLKQKLDNVKKSQVEEAISQTKAEAVKEEVKPPTQPLKTPAELKAELDKIYPQEKAVKPPTPAIPAELEGLAEEARKAKDVEEFTENIIKRDEAIPTADKAKIFYRSSHYDQPSGYNLRGNGIFFGNDLGMVKNFSPSLSVEGNKDTKIYIAKLNVKNPYYMDWLEFEDLGSKGLEKLIPDLKKQGYDSIVEKNDNLPKDEQDTPWQVAVFDQSQIENIGVIDNPRGRFENPTILEDKVKQQLTDFYHQATAGKAGAGEVEKPIKVYQGGGKTFKVEDRIGGMYLTKNKEYAQKFAGKNGEIAEGYVSLKKPYDLTDEIENQPERELLIERPENHPNEIKRLKEEGYDSIIYKDQILLLDANKVNLTPATEQPSEVAPIAEKATAVPVTGEGKVSKIAESIQAKSIEQGLTKGYGHLAEYTPIIIKEQAQKASDLINNNIDEARKIIRGDTALPEGLRGTALITAMEEHIKKTADGELASELASSPLVSGTSAAAQELRLAAERDPESPVKAIQDINKILNETIKKRYPGEILSKAKTNLISKIKSEIKKANTSHSWQAFIESIRCT